MRTLDKNPLNGKIPARNDPWLQEEKHNPADEHKDAVHEKERAESDDRAENPRERAADSGARAERK